MPWRTAPAWPDRPPPSTVTVTSNWPVRLQMEKGWLIIMRSTGRAKYAARSRPLIVILPEPRLIHTRATASLRLPVAKERPCLSIFGAATGAAATAAVVVADLRSLRSVIVWVSALIGKRASCSSDSWQRCRAFPGSAHHEDARFRHRPADCPSAYAQAGRGLSCAPPPSQPTA